MNINIEIEKRLAEVTEIFKEETQRLHKDIIDGSPVDKGRFKTSWQLREFNPKTITFRMYNPVKYGMKLWRYHGSKQGWSVYTGDRLLDDYVRRLKKRINAL